MNAFHTEAYDFYSFLSGHRRQDVRAALDALKVLDGAEEGWEITALRLGVEAPFFTFTNTVTEASVDMVKSYRTGRWSAHFHVLEGERLVPRRIELSTPADLAQVLVDHGLVETVWA